MLSHYIPCCHVSFHHYVCVCVCTRAQDGKIRLYNNSSLTRANTAIPGLGAPITAIDVTYGQLAQGF